MSRNRTQSPSALADIQAPVMVLAFAAVLICAGVAWLTQADALAATGRRIYRLEAHRADLLELQAEALVALAAATDPRTREARARALGFAPPHAVEMVAVPAEPNDGTTIAARWSDILSLLSHPAPSSPAGPAPAAHLFTVGTLPPQDVERR